MAILIPDYFDPDAPVAAQHTFGRLRNSQSLNSWMCFHSLSMMRQRHRRDTDPDFVLLGPPGVLVLKVKEGHVRLGSDGDWLQLNRRESSRPIRLPHGPFKETSAAMYALRGAMTHVLGREMEQVAFGFGVMFPDMPVFEMSSKEWSPEVVYQGADRLSPIHLYVERLAAYWTRVRSGKRSLGQEQIERYSEFLRANFEVAPPMTAALDPDGSEPVWFTKEQARVLDLMAENDRGVVGGPAGTGKTFIALEHARRLASRGKRTLLLCQSTLLGEYLSRVVAHPVFKGMVQADSVLSFLHGTIKASSLNQEFAVEYRKSGNAELYYQYFLRAVNEMGVATWDTVLIDQGNDVLSGDTLFALDYVLRGGFECGSWYVFYDDSVKADAEHIFANEVLSHLKSFGPAEYHLTVNCRSSDQIAVHTAIATGYPLTRGNGGGERVKFRWYEDPERQLDDLRKVVQAVQSEGFKPEDFTILYPGGQLYLRDGLKELRSRMALVELGVDSRFPPENGKIGFSSVQAFRGLESKVVILLGIDRIGEAWTDALTYLGMSRARAVLIVFMNERIRKDFQAIIGKVKREGLAVTQTQLVDAD